MKYFRESNTIHCGPFPIKAIHCKHFIRDKNMHTMNIFKAKKIIFALALYCLLCTQSVYGACAGGCRPNSAFKKENQLCHNETIIDAVAKYLTMDDFSYRSDEGNGRIISGLCKVSSNDNLVTIAVFVAGSGTYDSGELIIAMIDNQSSKIIASYNESLVNSDTPKINPEIDRLQIDTAHYDISPSTRAFGLDVIAGNKTSKTCGSDEISTVRTLFVKDGDKIKSIFSTGLPITRQRIVPSDPRCFPEKSTAKNTKPLTEDIVLKIRIGKEVTNSYANLLISSSSLYSDGTKSNGKPFHYELQYYNSDHQGGFGFYPIEDVNEAFEAWRREQLEEMEARFQQ